MLNSYKNTLSLLQNIGRFFDCQKYVLFDRLYKGQFGGLEATMKADLSSGQSYEALYDCNLQL